MSKSTIKLGELLLKAGRISEFQLNSALSHQRTVGGRLGASLVRLGYIAEDELLRFLAEQFRLPVVNLFKETVAAEVLMTIPALKARELNVLPIGWREEQGTAYLLVAISDPTNQKLLDQLQVMTGFRIAPMLVLETELRDAIVFYYGDTSMKPVEDRTSRPRGISPAPAEQPIPAFSTMTEAKFQALLKLLLDKGVLTLREFERLR